MMLSRYITLILPLAMAMGAFAQAPVPAKPAVPELPPFQGEVHYRITYPGLKDAALLAMLPDSQVVVFSGAWVVSRSFGGQATQQGMWSAWNLDSGTCYLVNETEQRILVPSAEAQSPKAKLTKNSSSKRKVILGHPCVQYDHVHDQLTDSWWINDSLLVTKPAVDSLVWLAPPFMASGRRGIPLRMLRASKAGTTLSEAVRIVPGNVPAPALPSYPRVTFDPLLPRHPLLGLQGK